MHTINDIFTATLHCAVQSHDSFWVESFYRHYVDVDEGKRGRDDLLFYVRLDTKQVQCICGSPPCRKRTLFLSHLTTISTLLWNLPESSNLGFSNFNLSASGEPTSGFNCQSIILGELIELS